MEFYFGLVCTSLVSLSNAQTTTLTTTEYPEFDNCGFNLNATCDDKMQLFADRNLLARSDDWRHTSVVYIPPNTEEIEIRCTDGWILGGILASSENGLITDKAWNCSNDNGITWKHAHELGPNGVTSDDISPDAKWIWTDRPTWKHTRVKRHTTAICTIQLPTNCPTPTPCTECVPCLFDGITPTPTPTPTPSPTPTPTPPEPTPVSGFNLNATCNNKMELFVDGNLLATSYNWRDTSQVHIPANTQTIEIHCTDSCWLIEGILASSDNSLLTDNSWNCSSDNGNTWSSAHEIVSNGLSVPDISPNAKWISTGQNTWRNGGKVICKVMLDLSVATTSTSKDIQPVSTTPMPTGCLYTDKYVECPEFKNECKTGNFIHCMNRDCAKTCKCVPIWSPWSSWSTCSASCGIAVKRRKRTCDGLPCPPGVKEEAASCHLPSCGPYIQQKCFLEDSNITFLDLGHNHMNQDLQPVWKIADKGRSLTEALNTRPSIGLSNLGDVTEPVSFSGRVFSASGDDDVIGMVFGFWNEANFFVIASARQHPGPTNWYVARLHATCGLSCAATTTISDAIWDPQSHPDDITVLATGSTYWQHGNEYNFTVSFNPAELLLSASVTNENQVEPILETGIISAKTDDSGVDAVSRKGGFVGVYVDSQAHTTWDYLVCQDSHLIAPTPDDSESETVLTIIENGQEVNQKTTFNNNTGILTIDVPPHITLLDQNFTQSTFMYHAKSDIVMTKSNSSCVLSNIPDNINAAGMPEYFQQLKEGTEIWDNNNVEIVYNIKMIKNIVPPAERKRLTPHMDNLCNNQIIKKSENLKIKKDQYEKLVNGDIIFAEQEKFQRSACNSKRACTSNGANSCGYSGWINPETGRGFSVHEVTSENICVECCIKHKDDHFCNCEAAYPDLCPCAYITDKKNLIDCVHKNGSYSLRFQDSEQDSRRSLAFSGGQLLTYNNEANERSVKIHVPSHGDNEEITVLMHAHRDGWWHAGVYGGVLKNNMVLKMGSKCHIKTLPTTMFPIDIATKMKLISDGNFIITPDNEKKKYSVLLEDDSLTSQEIDSLNPEIEEICKNHKLVKHQELEISQEKFQKLSDGWIIDLNLESQMDECNLQSKAMSVASGCLRWPNPGTGREITLHHLVMSVNQSSCCNGTLDHHSTYCNCQDILDRNSFERCSSMVDMIFVITGANGPNLYKQFERFIRNDNSLGLQLKALPEMVNSSFPVKTKGAVGAWIDNNLYVCQGLALKGVQDDNGCFMKKSGCGPWTKPLTTILTDPLKFGGVSAKYKSGPTGKEPGETWWIIGGDHRGNRTQEWNSVEGANPWDPPVLPQRMNNPCMVAISDREVFLTAIPKDEVVATNKAWIFSRDYKDNGGWKNVPSLKEERSGPACGFLPNNRLGWIVVAGGRDKSSTEILDLTDCVDKDWDCAWEFGPDLGSNIYGASLVTIAADYLVLLGDNTDILAINSTFQNWEVVGKTTQPRYDAVVLTTQMERGN